MNYNRLQLVQHPNGLYYYKQIPMVVPQRSQVMENIKPQLNSLRNAIYAPVKNSNNEPSYLYVHEDIADNYYLENATFIFICFMMVFLIFAIICCRYQAGIRIFRGFSMIISWIFYAFITYLLSFIIFVLNFIRTMVSWLWQTSLVGNTLSGYEFWYWGNNKKKTVEIEGITYVQK